MQELMTLLDKVTPGEWLLVRAEASVQVVVKTDPLRLNEGQVIMEIGGLTPVEMEANAKLIVLAKKAVPFLVEANTKLSAALAAALAVMEKADVVVPPEHGDVWATFAAALETIEVKPLTDAPQS